MMDFEAEVSLWRDRLGGLDAPIGWGDVLELLLKGSGFERIGPDPVPVRLAVKYFACGLLHATTLKAWIADPRDAALHEALRRRPSLMRCVARPYLNEGWRARRKLAVIRGHYRLLRGRLAFLRLRPAGWMRLASAGEGVEVRLEQADWFQHEGELTLSLFADSTRLYSMAFTLGAADAGVVAYVGAVQGLGREDALDIYRALTRRMHGLRPRDLLVAVFRSLCVSMEATRILAVSDSACVARSGYFGRSTSRLSSYDVIWTENGGVSGADGFFELSPSPDRRAMIDIPSRKRAEHRRRYEMLDELARQVAGAVEQAAANCAEAASRPPVHKGAVKRRRRLGRDRWIPDYAASSFSRF